MRIDSVYDYTWCQINRPHKKLKLHKILHGNLVFSIEFKVRLLTEPMLVNGLNDSEKKLVSAAEFIQDLNPQTAYISLPLRPSAEKTVRLPSEKQIAAAYHFFKEKIKWVEILAYLPTSSFTEETDAIQKFTGDFNIPPPGNVRGSGLPNSRQY